MITCLGWKSSDPFGIIGADTSVGAVKTDASWKCTGEHTDGWSECDFDDSNWPYAVVLQRDTDELLLNEKSQELWEEYPLYQSAEWIWTNDDSTAIYCRTAVLPSEF